MSDDKLNQQLGELVTQMKIMNSRLGTIEGAFVEQTGSLAVVMAQTKDHEADIAQLKKKSTNWLVYTLSSFQNTTN